LAIALVLALRAAAPALADPTTDIPDAAAERARLGVVHIRTLESFAIALGLRLGGPDDAAVFAAANQAIIAAKNDGGLAVALPVGGVERTSRGLLLDNNGGYFCPVAGQCTVRALRASDSSAPGWLVSVNDPFATNLVLSGIVFDGGWQYRRAPYFAAPETDPWLDRQGGVNITHAFSGVDDGRLRANSRLGAQLPSDTIRDLTIANFGGDCLMIAGAGGNVYDNIRSGGCGGRGIVINSYDDKFSNLDIGGIGRSCMFVDGQGAADYIQGKVWYCGSRLKPGDDQGVRLTSGGDILTIMVQDSYGDAIWNSGQLNLINAIVNWQGELGPMDPGSISAYTCFGCDHNILTLVAAIQVKSQAYPRVTLLFRNAGRDGRNGSSNTATISELGWPRRDPAWVWPAAWLEGAMDDSNRIVLDGMDRPQTQVRLILPGPYADDAAAATAGVPAGGLYRDGASLVHARAP
jgi:hypothetical protein